ncbi:hypothetical protein [Kutzneria albida]|nr:hypothetical protein [Kutzneria albida]
MDALLLRSGRISESDWTAALRVGAEMRSHQAELVARGSIKSTELQVISMMAAQDGAFAAFAGKIEECIVLKEPLDVLLPTADGIDTDRLLREAARRLEALASLPFPVSPYRERVVPVRGIDLSAGTLTAARQEILANASGRRSSRDIAFLIGRSVYSVTVEISRMLSEGLVEVVPGTSVTASPNACTVAPRASGEGSPVAVADGGSTDGLPQRHPGASGTAKNQKALKPSDWLPLSRRLRKIRAGPSSTPTTGTIGNLSEPERKGIEP